MIIIMIIKNTTQTLKTTKQINLKHSLSLHQYLSINNASITIFSLAALAAQQKVSMTEKSKTNGKHRTWLNTQLIAWATKLNKT